MKIRLVVALVGLAISFALPTLAQTIDPQLRAAAEAIDKTFDDSQNSGNPVPIIAVFAKDGIVVTNVGPIRSAGDYEILHRSIQGRRCLEEAVANLERKPAPGSNDHAEQQIVF